MRRRPLMGLLAVFCIVFAFKNKETPKSLQVQAKEQHKNIAVYFCGSDWCTICHQFRQGFLETPAVDSVLKDGYVYYLADFPQRKKLEASVQAFNNTLAEKLNTNGVFPLLVIADENLNIKSLITKGIDYKVSYQTLIANQKK